MDFNRYFKTPTQSPVINSKLLLLTKGLIVKFQKKSGNGV